MKKSLFAILVLGFALLSGCQSVYYGAMEKMGSYKRDILVDRVEEAKGAQENARAQFANAFDEFLGVSQVDIQDLKSAYDRIEDSFQRSERDAQAVLDAFRDQTLFLKHNLNAQAVAALNQTAIKMRYEVDSLIQQMSASIEEANAFIAQMRAG